MKAALPSKSYEQSMQWSEGVGMRCYGERKPRAVSLRMSEKWWRWISVTEAPTLDPGHFFVATSQARCRRFPP